MLLNLLKFKIIIIIIIIFTRSFFLKSNNTRNSYNTEIQQGINYYSEKNYKKAIALLDEKKSNSDILQYLRLKSMYHLENHKSIVSMFTNKFKNSYLNSFKNIYVALSFYALKQHDKSIDHAVKIKEDDNYIKYLKYRILAESLYAQKKYSKAIKYYEFLNKNSYYMRDHKIKLNFLDTKFEENNLLNTFDAYYHSGNFLKFFSLFIHKNSYIKNRGKRDGLLIKTHDTIKTMNLKINTHNKYYMGQELYYIGKYKEADQYFKKVLTDKVKGTDQLKAHFYTALMNKNKKDKFDLYLKKMITQFYNSDNSYYHYARAHYLNNDMNTALTYYKKIIQKGKKIKIIKDSFEEIINIYEKSKNTTEYENHVKQYYNRFKEDKDSSKLYFKSGLVKLNNGQEEQSLKIFQDLINNKYYGINTLYLTGKIYYNKKEYEKAYQQFFKLIENNNSGYYFLRTSEFFKKIPNKKLTEKMLQNLNKYKKQELRYNLLKHIITQKDKYRKEVNKLLHKKYNLNALAFGQDKVKLINDKEFKNYLLFKQHGLYDEAYFIYLQLSKKYKKRIDFLRSLLVYNLKNNWLKDTLFCRNGIAYWLKISSYISCLDKKYLKYYYPMHYDKNISKILKERKIKISKSLLLALMKQESGFNKYALSSANACGLLQIMPSTGTYHKKSIKLKSDDTLYNINENLILGITYFNQYLKNEEIENIVYALCSYNAGNGNTRKWKKRHSFNAKYPEAWIELISYPETRNYVKKVLTNQYYYKKLME